MSDEYSTLKKQNEELTREIERLQKELADAQSANVAKEAFLSNMSHDIRTPMNAIIGMTALAKKHIDEKARVSDALNKIETAGAHLLSLINDVLDMSRINSGRMSITEELFSLGDLLHDTLTIIRPQAEQRHHDFGFETKNIFAESLYGDPLRLRQIFVNIISNAIKYTKDNGRILVTVAQEMKEDRCDLLFRCEDNGIGMTPEFLERIFDPFERVSSSTLSGVEGTGLGMSIVKKLIDAMGGTIGIESEPDKGSVVTIRIPMRYEIQPVRTNALEGQRILIVEADEELKQLYTGYLSEFGIDHYIVSSSSEAVAAITEGEFRSERFTCVIIGRSIGKPGNIFELASYLHQADSSLVLVLISDQKWESIEYHANRSGISYFIPIPFFRKTLINGLAEALSSVHEDAADPEIPDLTGKKILLAEDNLINREIACEIIRVTNAAIDCAENGQEAVDLFEKSSPGDYDMILMDIQMPVMDGYTAVKTIRSADRPDAETVKIWAMTANAFAEDVSRAKQSGMNGHIAKPIDIKMLMQILRQIQ